MAAAAKMARAIVDAEPGVPSSARASNRPGSKALAVCVTGESQGLAQVARHVWPDLLSSFIGDEVATVSVFAVIATTDRTENTPRLLEEHLRVKAYTVIPDSSESVEAFPREAACFNHNNGIGFVQGLKTNNLSRWAQAYWQASKMQECFRLIVADENTTGRPFDFVMKMRPDAEFCFRVDGSRWLRNIAADHTAKVWVRQVNRGRDGHVPTDVVNDNFALMPRMVATSYFSVASQFESLCSADDLPGVLRPQCGSHSHLTRDPSTLTLECILSVHLRNQSIRLGLLSPIPHFQLVREPPVAARFACDQLPASIRAQFGAARPARRVNAPTAGTHAHTTAQNTLTRSSLDPFRNVPYGPKRNETRVPIFQRRVAFCMSGALPTNFDSHEAIVLREALQQFATELRAEGSVYASVHREGSVPTGVQEGLKQLQPTAYEYYSTGPYSCSLQQRLRGPQSSRCHMLTGEEGRNACEFYFQFDGVRRAWRMMQSHEA